MFGTHNTNLPQRANVLHNHSCSHSLSNSNSHSHSRPNEGEYTPISIFTCSCSALGLLASSVCMGHLTSSAHIGHLTSSAHIGLLLAVRSSCTQKMYSSQLSFTVPDADTLIRAKNIQSIITDRQTNRQTTTASSQAQAVLRALLAGTRQATLVSMDGVAARSLAARPHSSCGFFNLDSTPLQHCNLTRLAVSHLMAALALHLVQALTLCPSL